MRKGSHHKKEVKQRISQIMKGRKPNGPGRPFLKGHGDLLSLKARKKQANKMRGKNNPNWKGGTQRGKHHGDSRYLKWRTSVFKRDNWICQTCGARSQAGEPVYLEAHHIKSWANYPELRFNIDNGITLCKKCHKLAHKIKCQ